MKTLKLWYISLSLSVVAASPLQAADSDELINGISRFTLGGGDSIRLAHEMIVTQGVILLSITGTDSPGSVILQINRNGSNNGVWSLGDAPDWGVGQTSEPDSGDFRIWVNGGNANDPLYIQNSTDDAYYFTVYNMPTIGERTGSGTVIEKLEDCSSTAPVLPGSSVEQTIEAGDFMTVDSDLIDEGPILVSVSGDDSPGSAFLQIYRKGNKYDKVQAIAQTGNWSTGTTSEPSSGGMRAWIDDDKDGYPLIIKNTYSYSLDVRIYNLPPTRLDGSAEFNLPAKGSVTVPSSALLGAGLALLAFDGDGSPSSILVQIQRTGDGNGTWCLAQIGTGWSCGTTSAPSSGSYRMYIDGDDAGARLILKSAASWSRDFRIYNFRP